MHRVTRFLSDHPHWAALAFGLISALGFPPLGLWPFALAALAGFAWLVREAPSWRGAFRRGWFFGIAHFTLTNNWIATAFTYQAEMPQILGWFAVPLLSLYLAVYPALAAAIAFKAGRKGWLSFGLTFAAAWVLTEWLRSWVFTGYAWGPLSLILLGPDDRPGLAAVLPYLGTYALSGAVMLLAVGFLAVAKTRRRIPLAIAAALIATAMYLPTGEREEGTLAMTLVQPDIRQEVLDDPSNFEDQFLTLARLSAPRENLDTRLVLWPESGVPDYLRPGYPIRYYVQMTAAADPDFARFRIGQTIGEGSLLLTGAVDLEIGPKNGRPGAIGAYNSITPITADGTLGVRYAKAHLVPYGEYLPMRSILEPLGLTRLVAGTIDFIPGPGPQTRDFGRWGKAAMQICYEIVFSGEVIEKGTRPDYIFNPSNDGWFGAWGPPQHLAQARLRAIEEGVPVLRSTTTGISAVVDADGVVRASIGMRRTGRIDMNVPPANPPTLFSRFGHWLTLFWGVLFLTGSLVASRKRSR